MDFREENKPRPDYDSGDGAGRDGNRAKGNRTRTRISRPTSSGPVSSSERFDRPRFDKPDNGEQRQYGRESGGSSYQQRPYNRENRDYRSDNRGGGSGNYYDRNQRQDGGGYQQRRPYNRDDNNNEQRGSYNRDRGGYQQRSYNRNDDYQQRPSYNRPDGERSYNRQDGERSYNRQDGERSYNRGGYNNDQRRPSFNRGGGGGDQRRPFNRGGGGSYGNNRTVNPGRPYEYKPETPSNDPIRLNKFLANAGICSRREADEYIQAGVVSVNGEIINELGVKVLPTDKVLFHDQLVQTERKIYILLNKPKDFVTTVDDPKERKTVLDLVRNACRERIYPVGRLDRSTTGVLLLTNDGDLASKLTHPKYNKKKIYHVHLDKPLTKADMEQIVAGIELEDGEIHADEVHYVDDEDRKQVGIEIHSGRNRIVRRIFDHMGYHVKRLDRVFFAGLTKKSLPRGKWRFLTPREVNMLKMGAFE
jgi:23S rRNA pseudouridine2605 synthase